MTTKSKTKAAEKDSGKDLATFERLPETTQDLLKLKDQAEKTTGPEQVVITGQIERQARTST